jgi:hypothetical protein
VLAMQPNGPIAELYFTPTNTFIKNGQRLDRFAHPKLVNGHRDHRHVALKTGHQLFSSKIHSDPVSYTDTSHNLESKALRRSS